MTDTCSMVLTEVTHEATDVLGLTLEHPDGQPLPEWEPGAHVDLVLKDELVRQYSLCGDPADRRRYYVAVLREQDGSGGSAHVHTVLRRGDLLGIRGPRNHFRLVDAPAYLFIAGGIGVTPIVSMVEQVAKRGAEFSVLYGGRSMASMAFTRRLSRFGSRVRFVPQDMTGLLDLDAALRDVQPGTKVYCCGPESLISATEQRCELWNPEALHVERFAARDIEPRDPATETGVQVLLQKSGVELTVPPDRSILDVVLEAGFDVPYDCSEGICGSCEVKVIEGDIEHRDEVLTKWEQESNAAMMICCSRARSERIVLDL